MQTLFHQFKRKCSIYFRKFSFFNSFFCFRDICTGVSGLVLTAYQQAVLGQHHWLVYGLNMFCHTATQTKKTRKRQITVDFVLRFVKFALFFQFNHKTKGETL